MIKHVVMWKIKSTTDFTKEENVLKAQQMLNDLFGKIPQILELETGINFNDSDAAFDLILYTTFNDKNALEIYQKHELHVEVANFIGAIRTERAVVDYNI